MRTILGFYRLPLALLLAIAVLIIFHSDSLRLVEAATFSPTSTVTLGDSTAHTLVAHPVGDHNPLVPADPGSSGPGHPSIDTTTTIPGGDAFFSQFFSFTPASVATAPDLAVVDGTLRGAFDFLVNVGLGGAGQCNTLFGVAPLSIDFLEATTSRAAPEFMYRDLDSSGTVSAGDVRLSAVPPFAAGSTVAALDSDLGGTLIAFNANEKHIENVTVNTQFDPGEFMYRDLDSSGTVSAGDVRLSAVPPFIAGSTVSALDSDVGGTLIAFNANEKHSENVAPNLQFDHGLVPFTDTAADGSASDPIPGNGVPAGADGYPTHLALTIPGGEIARFYGHTVIALGPTPVDVHYLTYPPGSLGLPAALGKPTIVTFNTGDPGAPTPTGLGDSCPFFTSTVRTFGRAGDNPNTGPDESAAVEQPGPDGDAVNVGANCPGPAACADNSDAMNTNTGPGTVIFALLAQSVRDADSDGFDNSDDTCMYNPNVGSVYTIADPGDAGEAAFFLPAPLGRDGIDAACDNSAVTTDGIATPWSSGPADDTLGSKGACRRNPVSPPNFFNNDDFPTLNPFGRGSDCDLDGFNNRGDVCPQVANPTQLDSEELLPGATYLDGGPKDDDTGDACDINPGVPDGHFHDVLRIAPQCITGGGVVDTDGDGYCDPTEGALGSDSTVAGSTPEHLAIPTTCSDGANNDAPVDAATDLADTGCQKTPHDIKILNLTGQTSICSAANPPNSGNYNLLIRNNGPAASESVEVGILLDALPASPPPTGTMFPPTPTNRSAGSVTNVLGPPSTVTVSGPINTDGDIDVEWLTKVVVSIGPGLTPVLIKVTWGTGCLGNGDPNALDYTLTADVCHGDDVAPLGLFGAAACGATADAGQDRSPPNPVGNDAAVTKSIDDDS